MHSTLNYTTGNGNTVGATEAPMFHCSGRESGLEKLLPDWSYDFGQEAEIQHITAVYSRRYLILFVDHQ